MGNRCTEEPYQKEERRRDSHKTRRLTEARFPGLLGSSKSSPEPKNVISFPVAAGSALERGQHARTSNKTVGMEKKTFQRVSSSHDKIYRSINKHFFINSLFVFYFFQKIYLFWSVVTALRLKSGAKCSMIETPFLFLMLLLISFQQPLL